MWTLFVYFYVSGTAVTVSQTDGFRDRSACEAAATAVLGDPTIFVKEEIDEDDWRGIDPTKAGAKQEASRWREIGESLNVRAVCFEKD